MTKETFNGFIAIWIDGYRNSISTAARLNFSEDDLDGWALGTRNHYCSRHAFDKLQRFTSFDDAVTWIDAHRRKRPHERFQLIYVMERLGGRDLVPVATLDEILKLDEDARVAESHRKAWLHTVLPYFEELTARYGARKAGRLGTFILSLRKEGIEAVQKASRATFYRAKKDLEDAGLPLETVARAVEE